MVVIRARRRKAVQWVISAYGEALRMVELLMPEFVHEPEDMR